MAHSSDIARVRKYLASDFHAIHGVHPYCMRPDRFRQLHGFSQAAARAMGMYPDSGDSIFEVPPLPYAPPPTPWTDYVPGVYRTSARFRPEAAPEGDAECCAKTLILNGRATWRQLQRLYDMLPGLSGSGGVLPRLRQQFHRGWVLACLLSRLATLHQELPLDRRIAGQHRSLYTSSTSFHYNQLDQQRAVIDAR